jgi:hypothetical protein
VGQDTNLLTTPDDNDALRLHLPSLPHTPDTTTISAALDMGTFISSEASVASQTRRHRSQLQSHAHLLEVLILLLTECNL